MIAATPATTLRPGTLLRFRKPRERKTTGRGTFVVIRRDDLGRFEIAPYAPGEQARSIVSGYPEAEVRKAFHVVGDAARRRCMA